MLIRSILNLASWLRRRSPRQDIPSLDVRTVLDREAASPLPHFGGSSKPYTRWWWLAGPFRREDITEQLTWLRSNGFGGVELAWLWPTWISGAEPGLEWLGPEWSELVAFTKREADRLGLGCDFTFGCCWPFGGTIIGPKQASRTFDGLSWQRLAGGWEEPIGEFPYILNHLDGDALRHYAEGMFPAFSEALQGSRSALFCDSLELDTRRLWSPRLWERFAERHGYRLEGLEDSIDDDPGLRYDYRTVIAEAILAEFYESFTAVCHEHDAFSRVQCHGAPTDLLSAYAAVDIPESESLLFPPHFSRIAASAAALSGKQIVSAETFTCLYGFVSQHYLMPLQYWHKEQTADLKLLADALFAQGVNQVIWHGMPFNGPGGKIQFYASVHVGPNARFAGDLPAFNAYLERVSALLKLGRTEARLAVYLPNEDNRRLDRIPDEERTPGSSYRWEMRHVAVPREIEGYSPLWVSQAFLARGQMEDGLLAIGDCRFQALLVDVEFLDIGALREVVRLARAGLRVILPRTPSTPGRFTPADYDSQIETLRECPTVVTQFRDSGLSPIVSGDDLPPLWCRRTPDALYVFFAHPSARELRYPMRYGQSLSAGKLTRQVRIEFDGSVRTLDLTFEPYQSLMVCVRGDQGVQFIDISYQPPEPDQAPVRKKSATA